MKKLLLTLMLAVVSSSAMAEWTPLGNDHYLDFDTIRRTSNVVEVLVLLDFKPPNGFPPNYKYIQSTTLQIEYDCLNDLTRTLHRTYYNKNMGRGEELESLIEPTRPKWGTVPTGNRWKVACEAKK